jgi:hypothetical protein
MWSGWSLASGIEPLRGVKVNLGGVWEGRV